jgi:hypothetical protein
MFLTRLTLTLDLDWSRSEVHSLPDWLKFYTNSGAGVKIHSMAGNFCGQRGVARIRKKNPELQTMQVVKMATHTLIENAAFLYIGLILAHIIEKCNMNEVSMVSEISQTQKVK